MLLPSSAIAEDSRQPKSLTVLNYETGWTHDGAGYHPAVFMLVVNSSGRDLSSTSIKFQARFTDMETMEVTVGRKSVRRTLKPSQQLNVAIIGRESSNGMEGFELPFEVNYWPKLETKVMCRVGEAGDEGTETLLIAKVDPETRAEDQTFEHLNQTASYNGASHNKPVAAKPRASLKPEKPLLATPDRYGATPAKPESGTSRLAGGDDNSTMTLLSSKSLPGLGDDFFRFEQRYGLPVTVDPKLAGWTWAKYKHGNSGTEILAGSKDRAKVDVIVIRVPRSTGSDQLAVVAAAKQLSGKYHTQTLPTPARSVRYLPSGRLEVATCANSAYKAMCMTAPDAENTFFLVVSRLPQDVETLLAGISRKSTLLKQFQFLDGRDGE
jgi:hypothetical protein